MPTNTAIFPQSLSTHTAVTATAVTSLNTDAASNIEQLLVAGPGGAEITALTVLPRATSAATVGYVLISTDGGTTKRLVAAKTIAADTVSTTDAPAVVDFGYSDSAPLRLGPATIVYVGVSVALAAGWVWHAQARGY